MSSTTAFNTEQKGVADASGNVSIQMAPKVGQRWDLNTAAVSTGTTTKVPKCFVYMNGTLVDATFTGNMDSTGRVSGLPLFPGQTIRADWTGMDAGVTATLSITGTETTGWRR